MTDLETRLQGMLRERAQDVATLPSRFLDPASLEDDRAPEPPRHTRIWLVAASIVAVLAVAGGVIAIGRSNEHPEPPATSGTTSRPPSVTSTPPTPTPTPPRVTRTVAADRLAFTVPKGYRVVSLSSRTYYRQIGLEVGSGTAPGNGGTSATAFVTVYEPHRFDGFDPSWRTTTYAGGPAYVGKAALPGGSVTATTLVFTSAAGRTVLVQGDTASTSSEAFLRKLADALRPDLSAPISVPFRLGALPGGLALTNVEDDRSSGYSFTATLSTGTLTIELEVRNRKNLDGFGITPGSPARAIDGRPGVVDSAHGQAAVQVDATTALAVRAYSGDGTTPQPTVVQQVLSGLSFADTTLEHAIP